MKNARKRLSALSVAIGLLVVVACGGVAAWAAGGWPDGTSEENTLTVTAASDEQHLADLAGVVSVDVYQIATAAPDEGYVKYNYTLTEAFGALTLDDESKWSADAWNKLAEDAAKLVTADMGKLTVAADDATPLALPADGLYLVMPHGTDVTPTYGDDVAASLTARGAVREDKTQYDYTFAPTIFAAPTAADAEGAATTAGTWTRDVQIVLKPTQEPCKGYLEINKTVVNSGNYKVKHTSFAFKVEGTQPNGELFSDVVSIDYTGSAPEPKTVGPIQAGTEVTVTEVPLNEAAWSLLSENDQKVTIESDSTDAVSVSFENEYIPTPGYAVENTFKLESTGESDSQWDWEWVQVTPDSARTDQPTQ